MGLETPGDRLAHFRKVKGLKLRELAEPLGLSIQSLSRWERGDSPIPTMGAQALERSFGVVADWLLTGRGYMEYPALIGPPLTVGVPQSATSASQVIVPVLSATPCAGDGSRLDDYVDEVAGMLFDVRWLLESFGVAPSNLCILRVVGDSMVPTIHDNDLVFVDGFEEQPSYRDGVWVLRMWDQLYVKRVQRFASDQYRATSDNPKYQPLELDETAQLLGRIVGGPPMRFI